MVGHILYNVGLQKHFINMQASLLLVKVSCCKFWICWVDVNLKFTVWQLILHLHPLSKFKIYKKLQYEKGLQNLGLCSTIMCNKYR